MKVGSLFSGIGAMDLGLCWAGMEIKWQVENDPYCQRVLAKHWPDVKRHDDVKTFPPKDWTDDELDVDIITAGFPCQDLSVAGKGAGLEGERSGLFYEIIRMAGLIRHRWLLLENVSALLNGGLDTVLRELAALRIYGSIEWHCLPASHVGAPHRRDRIFIICSPLADTDAQRQLQPEGGQQAKRRRTGDGGENVADANNGHIRQEEKICAGGNSTQPRGENVADTSGDRSRALPVRESVTGGEPVKEVQLPKAGTTQSMADTQGERMEGGRAAGEQVAGLHVSERLLDSYRAGPGTDQWASEPPVRVLVDGASDGLVRYAGRIAEGIPNRAKKLKGIGNAVVPQVAHFLGVAIMEADKQMWGETGT